MRSLEGMNKNNSDERRDYEAVAEKQQFNTLWTEETCLWEEMGCAHILYLKRVEYLQSMWMLQLVGISVCVNHFINLLMADSEKDYTIDIPFFSAQFWK